MRRLLFALPAAILSLVLLVPSPVFGQGRSHEKSEVRTSEKHDTSRPLRAIPSSRSATRRAKREMHIPQIAASAKRDPVIQTFVGP